MADGKNLESFSLVRCVWKRSWLRSSLVFKRKLKFNNRICYTKLKYVQDGEADVETFWRGVVTRVDSVRQPSTWIVKSSEIDHEMVWRSPVSWGWISSRDRSGASKIGQQMVLLSMRFRWLVKSFINWPTDGAALVSIYWRRSSEIGRQMVLLSSEVTGEEVQKLANRWRWTRLNLLGKSFRSKKLTNRGCCTRPMWLLKSEIGQQMVLHASQVTGEELAKLVNRWCCTRLKWKVRSLRNRPTEGAARVLSDCWRTCEIGQRMVLHASQLTGEELQKLAIKYGERSSM